MYFEERKYEKTKLRANKPVNFKGTFLALSDEYLYITKKLRLSKQQSYLSVFWKLTRKYFNTAFMFKRKVQQI